jgi:hypothetical protein
MNFRFYHAKCLSMIKPKPMPCRGLNSGVPIPRGELLGMGYRSDTNTGPCSSSLFNRHLKRMAKVLNLASVSRILP